MVSLLKLLVYIIVNQIKIKIGTYGIAKNKYRQSYKAKTDFVFIGLMEYKNTPLTNIGVSPVELLLPISKQSLIIKKK